MNKKNSTQTNFYTLSVEDSLKKLSTSSKGLSSHEAELRLHQNGFNELVGREGIHPFKILLNQFTSPLVWILIGAIIISMLLRENIDALVIGAIIILNTILGFVQEYKAEKAILALKKMASPKARVLRDGKEIKIESKSLVPGDIIILETGDIIPADARIIENHGLQTQEASLTGESQPVEKKEVTLPEKTILGDRKNVLFSTTIVVAGRGKAVITTTGMKTQVGKIAKLIQESRPEPTPLQKKLQTLGKYLTIIVIFVAIITFLAGILTGKEVSVMLLTAIALAVAAIPEGLPAVITISLALGVQRMVKRNALVRKLPSVETLGSVSVICTDKTGTLTHNQMTVSNIWANQKVYSVSGSGYSSQGKFLINNKTIDPQEIHTILKAGLLCNNAKIEDGKRKTIIGDPTEGALLISAEKAGIKFENVEESELRSHEIQFTSERKLMTTIHSLNKRKISYTKGAPEIILDRCDKILLNGKIERLDRTKKQEILQCNENFAKQSLRVLGFSYNDKFNKNDESENNMIFLGLQGMIDPPRAQASEAIKICKGAGIRVIMITGDYLTTAKSIANKLGIEGEAITGEELKKINLDEKIENVNIFARVEPKQKLDIIKSLKKLGHIVAMTGDGVNDAPALKKSDIGISMGISGTDVAKEASDIILTDDNFASIVSAIEEGRGIFDNIRKFVNYLLSSNLGEICVILFATLLGMPLPLTAIQILWINLVTDGLPAVALGLDPKQKDIMKNKPRKSTENIISKSISFNIVALGLSIGIISLVLFWLYKGSPLIKAQTIVFTSLVVFEVARLQMIRGEYNLPIFSNLYLAGAVFLSLLLQVLVIYTPLNSIFNVVPLEPLDWVWIIIATGILIFINKTVYFIQKMRSK